MINAMGLRRQDVYIANIVKCRPPENRSPRPDEIKTCLPYLEHQIAIIQPKVICALGSVAAQTLLETTTPISKMRGEFQDYRGIPLMPTYHPAYLLRNYTVKTRREVWDDMKKTLRLLEDTK
jgi:DNA polymerase